MNKHNYLLSLVFFSMMVAVGVVISPILRVEGMCPMAHLINITMAVFMGPWYSFLCALAIGFLELHYLVFYIVLVKERFGLPYLVKSLVQV